MGDVVTTPNTAESKVAYDSCYLCLAPVEKCGALCARCTDQRRRGCRHPEHVGMESCLRRHAHG